MKTILVTTVCLLLINFTYAQEADPIRWESIRLRNKNDYRNAEPTVKECVSYLLSHPYRDDDVPARSAARLIIRWMEGTKDHNYVIQSDISKFSSDKNGLIVIYMAALIKLGFERSNASGNDAEVQLDAFKILARYCDDPANKVEKTAAIDNLIKSYKEDKLKDILDIGFDKKGK